MEITNNIDFETKIDMIQALNNFLELVIVSNEEEFLDLIDAILKIHI